MMATVESGATGGAAPRTIQIIFAAALLVLFVALVIVLLVSRNVSESAWKNLVYVFGSVEALVFTAVGWVFGREVHRAQVASAEASAEDAKQDAADEAIRTREADAKAAENQMKVERLKTGIRMLGSTMSGDGPSVETRSGLEEFAPPNPALAELLKLAEES
jgi:type VI protein secretion system component VasK